MKGLVLSRYPHPDPQIVGWDHKKTNYPGAARKAFLGCFVNGTRLFGSFQRKISESNGTFEKVVLFFPTECSKRNLCSISSEPSLIPRSFLGKWN